MARARILLAMALLPLLSSCTASPSPTISLVAIAEAAQVPAGAIPAPDTQLERAEWAQVAAWGAREVAAGRPVVINLFASWCGPCRDEAPLLRDAIEDHPDVAFLLVDHLDRIDDGRAFLRSEGLFDVPSVFDDLGDVAAGLRARGMPSTAFFDAKGDLVALVTGVLTGPVLAAWLADIEATIVAT